MPWYLFDLPLGKFLINLIFENKEEKKMKTKNNDEVEIEFEDPSWRVMYKKMKNYVKQDIT